jgi:hypothetical protein
MRNLAVLFVPVLCFAAGIPASVESAIDMARAAPGEFAADGLIRIAALQAVDPARKVTLLEEAFRRAAEAQEPYKRHAGINSVTGSAGFLNRAYDQELDALTLRLRAVEAMLPLNKTKARDLFQQIPPLDLPKLQCADFLVYDVSRYYEVLGRIASETFSAKEIEKGEPFRLLLQHAGAIHSAAQVNPMARAIANARLKDGDFQALVAAFAGVLGGISGDDRSFTYAHSTGAQISAIADAMKSRKISPLPLLESYRLYLVKNLTASRCADDDLMLTTPQSFAIANAAPQIADDVAYFNQSLRMPPLQIIEAAEVTPAKVEGAAEGLRACEDTDCQAIAQQYRGLILQPNGLAWAPSDRRSGEWQAKLQDFLTAMAAWKENSSSAPAAQYFRNKCGVYSQLLGVVPTPEDQDKVIREMLDFVQRSKFQTESRIQWFLPVNALLGRAALDSTGLGKLMPQFRESRDPVIAFYAQLESVAPRGPERVMPLL